MDSSVTHRAVLVAGIVHVMRRRLRCNAIQVASELTGSVMAFQADREGNGAFQQTRIR